MKIHTKTLFIVLIPFLLFFIGGFSYLSHKFEKEKERYAQITQEIILLKKDISEFKKLDLNMRHTGLSIDVDLILKQNKDFENKIRKLLTQNERFVSIINKDREYYKKMEDDLLDIVELMDKNPKICCPK